MSDISKDLQRVLALVNSSDARPVSDVLPLYFMLDGKPYSLRWSHFMFEPMFRFKNSARKILYKCSRQIGKSVSLSASQILLAAAIPNKNLLTVTPFYEQVRKFSNNYVKPFIKTSPLKRLFAEGDTTDAVLQRSLSNGSNLFYSYSNGDPNRTRGIPVTLGLMVDECLSKDTQISALTGDIPVVELAAGDTIYGFCPLTGRVELDTVVAVRLTGRRPLWRLTLDDGSFLDCTDGEKLWTTAGWMYIAELSRQLLQNSVSAGNAANVIGLPAGGRLPEPVDNVHTAQAISRYRPKQTTKPAPAVCARPETGPVHSAQGVAPGEFCRGRWRARTEKSWVWRDDILFSDASITRIAGAYTALPTPVWRAFREGSDARVAGVIDPGVSGLLVHGRRLAQPRALSNLSHRGLRRDRYETIGWLADGEGVRSYRVDKPAEGRSGVLVCSAEHRGVAKTPRRDPSMDAPRDVLQVGHRARASGDLFVMQYRAATPKHGKSQGVLLHGSGVPESVCQGPLAGQESQRGTEVGTNGRAAAGPTRETSGVRSTGPGTLANLRTGESQEDACGPSETRGYECQEKGVESCEKGWTAARPVKVEYLGEEDVYDIETAKNHTFFANGLAVHNCQDMDMADIPVIEASMSSSPYKLWRATGTAKTFDNTIHQLWEDSSQAEWFIPCSACRYENKCAVDGDLIQIIADDTIRCARCKAVLDSRIGYWVHGVPERQRVFAGYHIPQVILPMHYESPQAWAVLKEFQRDKPKFSFYNEILGESFDTGSKMLTLEELRRACIIDEMRPDAFDLGRYLTVVVGVDWGGRGKEKDTDSDEFISNTAVAVAGLLPDGTIEVPFIWKVPYEMNHAAETGMVAQIAHAVRADWVALDYGGQGNVLEEMLVANGWPRERTCPFTYMVMPPARPIVHYKPPKAFGVRRSYILDKPRSILLNCELIKRQRIVFPKTNGYFENHLKDFMNIYLESKDDPRGPMRRLVKRMARRTDDVVHAVNFACIAIFHSTSQWPDIASSFVQDGATDGDDDPAL